MASSRGGFRRTPTPRTFRTCRRRSTGTRRRSRPTAATSATTRPCVTACPTADRHPALHSPDPGGPSGQRGAHDLRRQHLRRHVRARLPHRHSLRGRLRARDGRGQAGRDRPPPASRDRHADGRQRPSVRARGAHRPADRRRRSGPRGTFLRARPRAARPRRHRLRVRVERPGGLNEYGIAAYKATGSFAQFEVDWLLQIGGITIETGRRLGDDLTLDTLLAEFDAVFLGTGLDAVNHLPVEGERPPARARRGRLHRRPAPERRPRHVADRARRRGHRRRHDGDRRCDAVPAARRRDGHARLPARAREHGRVRLTSRSTRPRPACGSVTHARPRAR